VHGICTQSFSLVNPVAVLILLWRAMLWNGKKSSWKMLTVLRLEALEVAKLSFTFHLSKILWTQFVLMTKKIHSNHFTINWWVIFLNFCESDCFASVNHFNTVFMVYDAFSILFWLEIDGKQWSFILLHLILQTYNLVGKCVCNL
jgi:hypothetical protein